MKTQEQELKIKRDKMTKESWVRNVMKIYPEKTKEETEALWDKIHANQSLKP